MKKVEIVIAFCVGLVTMWLFERWRLSRAAFVMHEGPPRLSAEDKRIILDADLDALWSTEYLVLKLTKRILVTTRAQLESLQRSIADQDQIDW